MATKDVECDVKNLLVYTGNGDVTTTGIISNRSHFYGIHKLLSLESSVVNGEDRNECVFRHMCNVAMFHYVFIYVKNVPKENSWNICEVLFN